MRGDRFLTYLPNINGPNTLVFGGGAGIGAAVVESFSMQGAEIAIHYATGEVRASALCGRLGDRGAKAVSPAAAVLCERLCRY